MDSTSDRTELDIYADYQAILENFPNGVIALFDHELRYQVVNGAGLKDIGLSPSDLTGQRLRDVLPPQVFERDEPALLAALRGESTERITRLGDQWFRVLTVPVRRGDGTILRGMVMSQNITALKQAEVQLEEALSKLKMAVAAADMGVWEYDLQGERHLWNDRMFEIYGLEPAGPEVDASVWESRLHPEERAGILAQMATPPTQEGFSSGEFRIMRLDGSVRHLLGAAAPLRGADGTVSSLVGIVQDLTWTHEQSARLRESEARYRSLFESSQDAILLCDDAGQILDANPAAIALAGDSYDQLLGQRLWDRLGVETMMGRPVQWSRFLSTGSWSSEAPLSTTDAAMRTVQFQAQANIRPNTHLFILRDVTEQRKNEERAYQTRRLEALGQLTGGVAHDFNNLLQIINGQTQLVCDQLGAHHPVQEMLADILRAGDRARRLVSQLLSFGRRQLLRTATLDLNHVIAAMNEMLQSLTGERIRLDWHPSDHPALIDADLGMVEQVV
ncbi:MAG: PAS domain S-box protein, partial [Myxococcota bacterium]